VANYDGFLGYIMGATIAFVAVLLVVGDAAPRHGASNADIMVTSSKTAAK
jgi:gas vesicle protein